MNSIKRLVLGLLLAFVGSVTGLYAQSSDYNPENPADPITADSRHFYTVTTSVAPNKNAGFVSFTGSSVRNGKYAEGSVVTLNTSDSYEFTFKHWTKNGEFYSSEHTCTYTVEAQETHFVAVYEYTPHNPNDPNVINKQKLYLRCEPEGVCSFNQVSGAYWEADNYVPLNVNASSCYRFDGWYNGIEKVSDVAEFNYLMPFSDITLVARFTFVPFNPENPEDPVSAAPVLKGDVNGDGKVTVADAVAVIDYYLHWNEASSEDEKYDINGDGHVTVADAVDVITIYLTSN